MTETTTEQLAITRELVIDASPETVWQFLVDPEKILRWKGIEVILEPHAGGAFRCVVIPGRTARGSWTSRPLRTAMSHRSRWGPTGTCRSAVPTLTVRMRETTTARMRSR